jgi:Zn-dependent metalloprotease
METRIVPTPFFPMRTRFVQSLGVCLVLLLILAVSEPTGTASQDAVPAAAPQDLTISAVEQAECLAFGDATTARQARTGLVRSITTASGRSIPHPRPLDAQRSPEDAARAYLSICGSLFGLDAPAAQLALRDARNELTADRGAVRGRRSFVRFQQTHGGVPILAGELNVLLDDSNNILFVGGKTSSGVRLATTPEIEASAAVDAALDVVAKAHGVDRAQLTTTPPALWIYDPKLLGPDSRPARLVWRLEVTPRTLLPIRELVLVNAQRGGVALHFNQVETAQNRLTYTVNHGFDPSLLPGTLVCNEVNASCAGGDDDAVSAHQYAADTYSFYLNTLGRDSIDNAGLTMTSSTHYGVNYQNAFWNGLQMVYGDGFSRGDDVVGHELTHGVTQNTSHLFYYYQSGAINESLSDVFGELIDLGNGRGNDSAAVRWLLGEDIAGGAIRNMANPPAFGDPDRMTSPLYFVDDGDNGGVHFNSGINNKAAALMVDGGTFNGQTIAPLGPTKVAKIYYEVQTHLLTSGSDYGDLYDALYQGCNNLIGVAGITSIDCMQVRNATIAVEMNLQPVPAFNPDAPFCAGGQTSSNLFFDNFESGFGHWSAGVLAGTNQWLAANQFAHSGSWHLEAIDWPLLSDSFVTMVSDVALPADAFLRFSHSFEFEAFGSVFWDGGVVEYSTNGGATWIDAGSLMDSNGYRGQLVPFSDNPLHGRLAFVGVSHGYTSTRLNLQSLAGQPVRFRWRQGTDSSGGFFGWHVDDVQIYTCATAAVTANSVSPSSGTGTNQTFTFQYGDAAGANDLATVWMWINATFTGSLANSCLFNYTPATNTLALFNDAGTATLTGTLGSGGTLQNSQCAIALGSSTMAASGNTLTLTLPVTFMPAYAGPKTIFMFAGSGGAPHSGWQTRGTWTVPTPAVITADSATPNAGNGTSQTFALQFGDTAGANDLTTTWTWISPSFTASLANSCLFNYTPATNTLALFDNAATATFTGVVGSIETLHNSQCAISLAGSTAVTSGNTLTLTLPLTFMSPYAGAKTIFMFAANGSGTSSGWQTRGTWTVPAGPPAVVTADSITPNAGTGASQTFALQFGDTAGANDLTTTWTWISPSFTASLANSCLFNYTPATNTLVLFDDAGTATFTGTLGSDRTLHNSQCEISLAGSTGVGSGNTLTVTLPVTFTPAYAGAKTVFMFAANGSGTNSGWQTRGTWTVPGISPPPVVTADSVAPSAGSGMSQTFALQFGDTAGATNLFTTWTWISASFTATLANSCLFNYTPTTNTLALFDDAGTATFTGTLGSNQTLHNSQCEISLAGSTGVGSGNTLTVTLPVRFTPAFAGTKSVFMFAANGSGTNSGWQTRGTWTVP